MERMTRDFINNHDFVPQSNPSIAEWCDVDFDASVVGPDPRTWVWVSTKMQQIKCMCGVSLSPHLMRKWLHSMGGRPQPPPYQPAAAHNGHCVHDWIADASNSIVPNKLPSIAAANFASDRALSVYSKLYL